MTPANLRAESGLTPRSKPKKARAADRGQHLGWAPQISLDRGLRDLVEWAGHSGKLIG